MKKLIVMVVTGLFLMGLAGLSFAGGMKDPAKGTPEEAKEASTEALKGMDDMKDAGKEQAIKAQGATEQGAGGMMDQLKEGAKGEVNETGKTANEKIDNIGK